MKRDNFSVVSKSKCFKARPFICLSLTCAYSKRRILLARTAILALCTWQEPWVMSVERLLAQCASSTKSFFPLSTGFICLNSYLIKERLMSNRLQLFIFGQCAIWDVWILEQFVNWYHIAPPITVTIRAQTNSWLSVSLLRWRLWDGGNQV